MDHLGIDLTNHPLSEVPFYESIRVAQYNGEGFDYYFDSISTSAEAVIEEHKRPLTNEKQHDLLCIIQNYCFFALLDTVLQLYGVPFVLSDFVGQNREGKQRLSTACLKTIARKIALNRANDALRDEDGTVRLLHPGILKDAPTPLLALIGCSEPSNEKTCARMSILLDNFSTSVLFLTRLEAALIKQRALVLFSDCDYQLMMVCGILVDTLYRLWGQVYRSKLGRIPAMFTANKLALNIHARLTKWCPNRMAEYPMNPSMAALFMGLSSGDTFFHGPDLSSMIELRRSSSVPSQELIHQMLDGLLHVQTVDSIPPCEERKCHRTARANLHMNPHHRCRSSLDCASLEIDQTELEAIIMTQNSIPLVIITVVAGSITLKLVKYEEGMQYCAVSHVWSHGLGNTSKNSLPTCQLQKLHRIAEQVIPDAPIWIDSLCVPVSAEHQVARRKIITMMAIIYKTSHSTVILDKNLETIDPEPYRMGFSLLCSEWARRLWTLQEAILPGSDKLHVVYADGPVKWNKICNSATLVRRDIIRWMVGKFGFSEIEHLLEVDQLEQLNPVEYHMLRTIFDDDITSSRILPMAEIENPLEGQILADLEDMLELQRFDTSLDPERLIKVAQAIQLRTTSHKKDEFICIASLLGLELTSFAKLPSSMDEIIERVPIGDNLIFLPGPRLTRKGFRWAPASFIEQQTSLVHFRTVPAVLIPQGIELVKSSFISKHAVKLAPGIQYIFKGSSGYLARMVFKSDDLAFLQSSLTFEDGALLVCNPAFILKHDITVSSSSQAVGMAIVDIQSNTITNSDRLQARFILSTALGHMNLSTDTSIYDGMPLVVIPVEYQEKLKWVID